MFSLETHIVHHSSLLSSKNICHKVFRFNFFRFHSGSFLLSKGSSAFEHRIQMFPPSFGWFLNCVQTANLSVSKCQRAFKQNPNCKQKPWYWKLRCKTVYYSPTLVTDKLLFQSRSFHAWRPSKKITCANKGHKSSHFQWFLERYFLNCELKMSRNLSSSQDASICILSSGHLPIKEKISAQLLDGINGFNCQ